MSIKFLFAALLLLAATFPTAKAQTSSAEKDTLKTIVGKWSGTYAGDSSGKFELVVKQDNAQKLTGQLFMMTGNSTQKPINLKTISWKNGRLSASYTDPDEGDEVSFTGTYTDPDLEGTWKSDEGQATGTWQLTRVDS